MNKFKEESYIPKSVDVIASGYEWECPVCEKLMREVAYSEEVTCHWCKRKYIANLPEHAYD
uniref:Uncharacterized protein n=1 Tax=viral metagenome TaxID=1070528 RepID=A0A6M3KXR6_9ZZZZ